MTSRLKRKLDNMGVDVQSNSPRLTENFCLIGTPLPPLEKSKDTGEFVPLWKQEVRDEQGRRRLHGAFTGGFSAGYYNTVGSKEGWTPSTFSSSRSERAFKKQAKPEDFMDDEDLAELRESKKLVDTTEETDIFGGTQAELARRGEPEKDSIANALESLLPPAKDSVGARMLKKMGWRPGQGVGPRITYRQLRAQEGRPVGKNEVVDEEADKHLYAPRDTQTIVFEKKENSFGLGYSPGQGLIGSVQGKSGQTVESGPNLSAGFGLGALNDAEDDDIDVYDRGASREHRGMAYDVGETEDDDRITLGPKQQRDSKGAQRNAIASVTFRDGRPIVSGFVLFEKPLIEERWFPIPDTPKGWVPDPRRVWASDPSSKQDEDKMIPPASAPPEHRGWIKGKSADERGSLLGETPLLSAPRSVFDYLSQKDRDRLKNLASSLTSGKTPSQLPPPPPMPINVPRTDARTAQAALKGFQPFTTNPEKQLRYTTYLQSQASPDAPEIKPMAGQNNDNFNKEVEDYAKAALIFKPVSGAMAGRFATASTTEMIGSTYQGLHKPTKDDYAKLDSRQEAEAKEEEESPKAHAARMGMFGPLTREVIVWQPARLLCRRFGVKDPYPDGIPGEETASTVTLAKNDAWQAEVLKGAPNLTVSSSSAAPSDDITSPASGEDGKRDLANIGLGEDEGQGKDTLTYERPAKDIFKAIFASDEEDSDEELNVQMAKPGKDATTSETVPVAKEASNAKANHLLPTQILPAEPVDLTTFKPTFVSKSEREGRNKGKDKDKKDKKKKGRMVVSFDVEDESESREKTLKEKKDRPRKRQKERAPPDEDDQSMWVEKPPPELVKKGFIPAELPAKTEETLNRGRKRAVDFL
ncbi:DUF1604-domain-containing protein [Ramaria rubella]|nr:DUF1604-domain-containing protein [Ramaria rubella]